MKPASPYPPSIRDSPRTVKERNPAAGTRPSLFTQGDRQSPSQRGVQAMHPQILLSAQSSAQKLCSRCVSRCQHTVPLPPTSQTDAPLCLRGTIRPKRNTYNDSWTNRTAPGSSITILDACRPREEGNSAQIACRQDYKRQGVTTGNA